ncbi:MAG: lipid A biosynthesis acyltransferase, partial [Alistipes sp.]|nr:lipid A biosynthesis acyltransferase [Candidatus Minthomonas equi]
MSRRQWKGTTFGNGWMHTQLIHILKHVDARFIYLFAYLFVVPVCLLFNVNGSRKSSYSFYRKRMNFGRTKSMLMTCWNHFSFTQVVIDRFAMYAGKVFDVDIIGHEHVLSHSDGKEGFIQLSAHIGNYEIAGYTMISHKKIHAIVFPHEKASVMNNRNHMFANTNVCMIEQKDDLSHLFEIDKAICDGDIII